MQFVSHVTGQIWLQVNFVFLFFFSVLIYSIEYQKGNLDGSILATIVACNSTTIAATYNVIWCKLCTIFVWCKQCALQKIARDKIVPSKSPLTKEN